MKNKEKKATDVMKEIALQWKQMTESKKTKYSNLQKEDEQRYLRELKEFERLGGNLKDESKKIKKTKLLDKGVQVDKNGKPKKVKKEVKVKKWKVPFMFYVKTEFKKTME